MATRHIIAVALAATCFASTASAQMRVQGSRPIDPRLRNQPNMQQQPSQPTARAQQHSVAPVPVEEGRPKPQAGPNYPPVQTTRIPAASAQAGPLKRPSYLGTGEGVPSAGPSSLDLMKQCFDGSIGGTISNPACVGYIAGYVGAVRMSAGIQGFPVCLPEGGLSNESVVADVSAYLEANPDSLQKSARSVFFVVLTDRYPCGPAAQ